MRPRNSPYLPLSGGVPPRTWRDATGGVDGQQCGSCPPMSGIEMANWNPSAGSGGKWCWQFVSEAFRHWPEPQHLPELSAPLWGLSLKRPKKRLVKADEAEAGGLRGGVRHPVGRGARRTGAKIFFADEAHFRADAELRGKWVLKGEPAPRFHGGRLWWTRPARAMAKRPATTQQCAWRPVRWSGWTWRGTATPEPRLPSWRRLRAEATPGR